MKYSTGICANCGADDGLHHFEEPHHCPEGGVEGNINDKQRWQLSYFEDSGIVKLNQAAQELLEATKDSLKSFNLLIQSIVGLSEKQHYEIECRLDQLQTVIKKATE